MTGFEEPDSACIIVKDKNSRGYKMHLFLNPPDNHSIMWEGQSPSLEDAKITYQADSAHSFSDFIPVLNQILLSKINNSNYLNVFVDLPTYHVDDMPPDTCSWVNTSANQHISWPKAPNMEHDSIYWDKMLKLFNEKEFSNVKLRSLSPKIDQMRVVKSENELKQLRLSSEIASFSFCSLMRQVSSGNLSKEWDVEAHFEYQCKKLGATSVAYVPVVGCGNNACTIHYTRNSGPLSDGKLVLVDAGCLYNGYVSDITRTFPKSGKFSATQRLLYQAILDVQNEMIAHCRSDNGMNLNELLAASRELMLKKVCVDLFGLDSSEGKQLLPHIYPHHIGHWLGLDVHDTPTINGFTKFDEGMCLTVEPGIYINSHYPDIELSYMVKKLIPQEYHGIGIRIEDDIVIQSHQKGPEILTKNVPKEVKEIEALMS